MELELCEGVGGELHDFLFVHDCDPLAAALSERELSGDKDTIGFVLSGYTLTALLAHPFSGYLVDSFPCKVVLLTAYFVFFAFFAGYLIAGTMTLFAIGAPLTGRRWVLSPWPTALRPLMCCPPRAVPRALATTASPTIWPPALRPPWDCSSTTPSATMTSSSFWPSFEFCIYSYFCRKVTTFS